MKLISKLVVTGLSILLVQFASAQSTTDNSASCAPKACAPAPCPKPCAPKPCAPAPCPKPCAPKPCPPKPCCPPVCFERGYPNDNCCFPAAYSEPANYDLGPCPWDFWVDVSFTYWEAMQEGMDLAVSTSAVDGDINLPTGGQFYSQDRSFKPGFKIGLGMDLGHDDWSTYAEYTWFRSTTTTSATAPAVETGTPAFLLEDWVFASATGFSSKWRLNMDLVDLGVMRPFYQGTHLIMAPFGGLRGQFIRQNFSITADGLFDGDEDVFPSATSTYKSHSWAVGPRAGCLGKWHLGWGFRFEGDVAASLLYTRYTKISSSHDHILVSTADDALLGAVYKNYGCLRAVNEMNLGLGWGSYFGCRSYHFDLLLSYDFQVFWNQNMMAKLADSGFLIDASSASNLYMQGLTVKAQFDF